MAETRNFEDGDHDGACSCYECEELDMREIRQAHEPRPDQTAQGEGGNKSKRVCPCESLPNVGLNYPCVMTVNGQHCYVDVRRVEGKASA